MSWSFTSWQRWRCVTFCAISLKFLPLNVDLHCRWSWRVFNSFQSCNSLTDTFFESNKWVLNTTAAPLFFLWTQLAIAVVLFIISDALRLLPDRLTFDVEICKGLVPMVGLNVIGLRFVSSLSIVSTSHLIPCP